MYHFFITGSTFDAQEQLASRLRALRVARFLTQEDLAERSGLGRATIARVEAGQTTPHMRTIRALAQALDVTPQHLVSEPSALWSARGTPATVDQ